ncbi:MAG: universal stress protein [Rhodospirillaceae bacterium]|jgi:nucleotide-binding universal stress UspA family protein|nr:universal stress protein [Rhodospirillaceae bacterium]MBT5245105.1 universal stress protein [Rhodospirillaceae bacterium]MBT5562030.1 universal stress protein [Rhodospirillaceae bacterium]MBT6242203.1 universal stress protein [Rhodospirillaceae bacterium]MBT7136672.1 universal stress protein [Rhodospirillaceae bacterium]
MTPQNQSQKVASDEVEVTGGAAKLGRVLVALDASEYSDRALEESVRLAKSADGEITGIHAYAAMLHDRRFKQMEGGLPERYLEEEEMMYQRDVHDSLITRGLNIISDSYHDVAAEACEKAELPFHRLSPEGKNYARIVEAASSGNYDVLTLGALGLGAVPGSLIGTVCERVVRRSPIDTLVIKDSNRSIGDGPIVVGIDGSELSNGALMTALDIGRRLGVEVHAVAAYDPYYHYVAFNKIAGVLSDEAGKVFRFKEQEQLHEELIDDGIAKIYQSHLEIAQRTAADEGVELTTKLLDGKVFKAILDYLIDVNASLLVIGKTGVHVDDDLDIGGNAENLLRTAPCHVWLGQTSHRPPFEVIAEETISWSNEAEDLLGRAPEFARGMARKAVIRHAQEHGHTFITRDIVDVVSQQLMPKGCPAHRAKETGEEALKWAPEAMALVDATGDNDIAAGIMLRAEKKARREGASEIGVEHVQAFLDKTAAKTDEFTWAAASLARISRVPDGMREKTKARIEEVARARGASDITLEIVEAGLEEARKAMHQAMLDGGHTKTADAED